MSNSLARHHILWRNHWEIIIFGLKCLKYHTGIKYHYRLKGGKWQLNYVRKGRLFSEWWWNQTYFPGLQKDWSQEWKAETWVWRCSWRAWPCAAGKHSPEHSPGAGAAVCRVSPSCREEAEIRWDTPRGGLGSHPHWGIWQMPNEHMDSAAARSWLRGLHRGICWGHLCKENWKCASFRGKGAGVCVIATPH